MTADEFGALCWFAGMGLYLLFIVVVWFEHRFGKGSL